MDKKTPRAPMIGLNIPDLPPSVNHYWMASGHKRYLSKEAREWRELCQLWAKRVPLDQWTGYDSKNLVVEIEFTFPDNRRRDVGNYDKGVLDAFEGIFYKDDCQIKELILKKKVKAGEKLTQIFISDFPQVEE